MKFCLLWISLRKIEAFSYMKKFRVILKKHISKLLQCQKAYWRKRYIVRWTKLGNESTKFFHAAATDRYRINTITSIDNQKGQTLSSHEEKLPIFGRNTKAAWVH
jgi:hypothetical protein